MRASGKRRRTNGSCISSECSRWCAAASAGRPVMAISACAQRVVDVGVAERRGERALGIDRHAVERHEVRRPDQHDGVERVRRRRRLVGVRADRARRTSVRHAARSPRRSARRSVGRLLQVAIDVARERAGACPDTTFPRPRLVIDMCSSGSRPGSSSVGSEIAPDESSAGPVPPGSSEPRSRSHGPVLASANVLHSRARRRRAHRALARLELTADERESVRAAAHRHPAVRRPAAQVGHVRRGADLHPLALQRPLRDDEARPSLPRDDALRQAPDADRAAGLFKVPRVLGA